MKAVSASNLVLFRFSTFLSLNDLNGIFLPLTRMGFFHVSAFGYCFVATNALQSKLVARPILWSALSGRVASHVFLIEIAA